MSQEQLFLDPSFIPVATPTIEWDERGLMKGVQYKYRPDNSIDWRAMIEPQFLVVQGSSETDITKVPDKQLLVLLGGWKRLLFLRGYTSLTQHSDSVTPEKAVSTCTITFAPNYETRMQPVTYSWTASASYSNTSGDIPQMFLEATAANRAFCLCLRGFLNVNIAGKDEIGPSRFKRSETASPAPETLEPAPVAGFQAKDKLAERCNEIGLSFDKLKEGASKYKGELKTDPATWTGFDSITSLDAWTLLDKLTKAAAEAKGKVKK
jgi:hypothetical protein